MPGYDTDPRYSGVLEQACACLRGRHIPTFFLTSGQHTWWLTNHPNEPWFAPTPAPQGEPRPRITPLPPGESRHIATLAGGNRILASRAGDHAFAHMERARSAEDPTRVLDADPLEQAPSLDVLYDAVANGAMRQSAVDWTDPELAPYLPGPLPDFSRAGA